MGFGRKPKNEQEKQLLQRCYEAGMKNGWASGKFAHADGDFIVEEDRLNKNSICFIDNIKELKHFFRHGNWCLGQGVIYKDLFFLQQIGGGDEWATYKITDEKIEQFESITFGLGIKRGEFEQDIRSMRAATVEQCINLEY